MRHINPGMLHENDRSIMLIHAPTRARALLAVAFIRVACPGPVPVPFANVERMTN